MTNPPGSPGSPGRVVIISASVGAGHDGAAAELAARLRADGHPVDRHDLLDLFPARLGPLVSGAYHRLLTLAPWAYQRIYATTERGRTTSPAVRALLRSAEDRMLRVLPPDTRAVVSTYPGASQVLGALRLAGRLHVPVLTYLTDFSVHPLWVAPGVDLHLAAHPIPAAEARTHGAARVVPSGPVAGPRFTPAGPAERQAARARFGLPAHAPLALLVAGSWGVGPVRQVAAEIRDSGVAVPVVVCGRNETLAARLRAGGIDHAYGWVDDMAGLMHACDVLVQNAGGLSSLEAFAAGLPVASYRCIPGHGQTNAAALHAAGLATWIRDPADLKSLLVELLDGPLGRSQRATALALLTPDPHHGPVARIRQACAGLPEATGAGGLRPRTPLGATAATAANPVVPALRRLAVTVTMGAMVWATAVGTGIAASHQGTGVLQAIDHSLDTDHDESAPQPQPPDDGGRWGGVSPYGH